MRRRDGEEGDGGKRWNSTSLLTSRWGEGMVEEGGGGGEKGWWRREVVGRRDGGGGRWRWGEWMVEEGGGGKRWNSTFLSTILSPHLHLPPHLEVGEGMVEEGGGGGEKGW